jgi:L,D-peptidoglycan transpeptidase YkuD (ErfK/YbiS/YcfS/YnhG family)
MLQIFEIDPKIEQLFLVNVIADSLLGQLNSYHRVSGNYFRQTLQNIPVVIGKNGATANKVEGDNKTPLGIFKLGACFGRNKQPEFIKGNYYQIKEDDKFIDDPKSEQYNSWVSGATCANSYETMLRNDNLYDLGMIIEYNMHPVIANKGSAIFMHIWRNQYTGTEGCIALNQENLQLVLSSLEINSNPHIWIKMNDN